jgi:pyridoxamine 5'-phosphate oxidase
VARGAGARAAALAGGAGEPIGDPREAAAALAAATARIEADPSLVASDWCVWELIAHDVEFLQGAPSRNHVRIRYSRTAVGWSGTQLRA